MEIQVPELKKIVTDTEMGLKVQDQRTYRVIVVSSSPVVEQHCVFHLLVLR